MALLVVLPGLALIALAVSAIAGEERLQAERLEARRRELARSVSEGARARVGARVAALAGRLEELVARGEDPAGLLALEPEGLALGADLELVAPAPPWSARARDLPGPSRELAPALGLEARGQPAAALAALEALGATERASPVAQALRSRALRATGRAVEALAVDRALAASDAPASTRWMALERALADGARLEPTTSGREARAALARLLADGGRGGTPGAYWSALSRVAAIGAAPAASTAQGPPAIDPSRVQDVGTHGPSAARPAIELPRSDGLTPSPSPASPSPALPSPAAPTPPAPVSSGDVGDVGDVADVASLAVVVRRARAAADLGLLGPDEVERGDVLARGVVARALRAGPAGEGDGWLVLGPSGGAADGRPSLRAALVLSRPALEALVAEVARERSGADLDELATAVVDALGARDATERASAAAADDATAALGPGLAVRVTARATELGAGLARRRALQRGALLLGLVLTIVVGAALARRALRRTAELARLRADFVASVTHELRTPVASIRAMAEVLALGKLEPARQAEYYQGIAAEARRLGRRIEDVLDAARLEHGALHARPEAVDVGAAAHAVVEAHAAAASAVGLRLVLDAPPDLPPARVDPALLERALENLVENALKHGRPEEGEADPARREVRVSVAPAPAAVLIRVADRGAGIPRDEQPRVFERYFRGRGAKERPGAGLGLSIVLAIARAHAGDVSVEDTPGGGATFTLTLPRDRGPCAEAAGASPEGVERAAPRSGTLDPAHEETA